jgi:hypothetical protein
MSASTKQVRLEDLLEEQRAKAYFDSQIGFVFLLKPSPAAGAMTRSEASAATIVYDTHVPNAETEAAILEARAGLNLSKGIDRDDLFKKLND